MCHNHRTFYSCSHREDIVTLCGPILAPLVHRATNWPFVHTSPASTTGGHDVMLSAEEYNTLCHKCRATEGGHGMAGRCMQPTQSRLEEIDVFNLEASATKLDSLREQKPSKAKEFQATSDGTVSIRVDPSLREHELSSTARNLFELDPNRLPGPRSTDSLGRDLKCTKPENVSSITGIADSTKLRKNGQGAEAVEMDKGEPKSDRKLKEIARSVPYTGGLGLLVLPKRYITRKSQSGEPSKTSQETDVPRPGTKAKL